MSNQAPEIFQRALDTLDFPDLPAITDSGFEQAVIMLRIPLKLDTQSRANWTVGA